VKWFLLALHIRLAVPTMIALGVASAFTSHIQLVIPVISSGSPFGQLPFDSVTPLVLIVLLGTVQSAARTEILQAAVRNYPLRALCFTFAGLLLFLLFDEVTNLAFSEGFDFDIARNAIACLTIFLIAERLIGTRRAVAVPVIYVFASSVFGRQAGVPQPWALTLQPAAFIDVVVCSAILVIVATVLAFRSPAERKPLFG
jgi:hypothetical protein